MRADPRLLACVALVPLLAGCWSSNAEPSGSTPASPAPSPSVMTTEMRYAALGDSYSAAPFVPQTDLAGGCFRSSGNYPSLVAEDLGITDVDDVTCSGADTDLVTVGIGGNDENLFATLVHQCTTVPPGGSPCLSLVGPAGAEPSGVIRRTAQRVVGVLDLVHRKAPDAQVVLVGYPRLVDADRACGKIPIDAAELSGVEDFEQELRDALAGAAEKGDAEFVDMYALSEGHAICSDDPWVNGRTTDESRALAYHPFAVEQQVVAEQVEQLVTEGS